MRFLFTAFCFLSLICLKAQRVVDVTKEEAVNENMFQAVGGEPYVNVKFVRLVDGTPYFSENWMKGNVVLTNDKRTANGLLKLNLLDGEIHYLDKQNKEMIATAPVKEILLTDTLTNATFHFIHSSAFPSISGVKKGWFLQLTSGKANLFKSFNKQLLEQRPYGSATVEQKIETLERFYIFEENAIIEIKKIKDLPQALKNNKPEIENYLKKSALKGSVADKMIASVNYYNSLQ